MFEKDLELGGRAEEYILDILRRKFPNLKRIKGYYKGFDLTDGETSFEVKFDRYSKSSANIAFEVMSRGKPSGVMTTTADYWVHFYFHNNWGYSIIKSEKLLPIIMKTGAVVKGGDNLTSRIVLIKKGDFVKKFKSYEI